MCVTELGIGHRYQQIRRNPGQATGTLRKTRDACFGNGVKRGKV
jgi:hypothetical protein